MTAPWTGFSSKLDIEHHCYIGKRKWTCKDLSMSSSLAAPTAARTELEREEAFSCSGPLPVTATVAPKSFSNSSSSMKLTLFILDSLLSVSGTIGGTYDFGGTLGYILMQCHLLLIHPNQLNPQ